MKTLLSPLFDKNSPVLPILTILLCGGLLMWFIFGFLRPNKEHDWWEERANFCRAAGAYYTNNHADSGLVECRRLSDHSLVYIDTRTGARYTQVQQ